MIAGEILLGAALGFIAGLTGAGGAALAVPGLVFLLGAPAVTAVATTFPFTAIMKVFGSVQHLRQGSVNWNASTDLFLGTIPGTAAGILIISHLVSTFGEVFNEWLKAAIGLLLIISIGLSYVARRRTKAKPTVQWGNRNLLGIAAAAFCGVVIGGTSVGGGSLLIVVLTLFYRVTPAQIVGTSMVVSLVLMIVGTVGFWTEGLADLGLVWRLSIGAIPGVILGSIMTLRVSPNLLARVITAAIAVAGLSLMIDGILGLTAA